MAGWITNDPQVATHLRLADVAYNEACAKARRLKLADKVEALRAAREARQRAYDAVGAIKVEE